MAVFDLRDATLVLRGGVPTTQSITLLIGNGNITFDEKEPREYIKDRGNLQTVRRGNAEPMDVKFEFEWIHLQGINTDTAPTVEDVLKQRGLASTWTSASSDLCEPYCVDVVIKYQICSTDTGETIIMPDFRYESLNHDAKAGMVSCSGKCNATQAISNRGALPSY
jgi:hypothetical protein